MSKLRMSIKDWELYTGIKVVDARGFFGKKSKRRTNLYSQRGFFKGLQNSIISVKTDKGIDFLEKGGRWNEEETFIQIRRDSKRNTRRG